MSTRQANHFIRMKLPPEPQISNNMDLDYGLNTIIESHQKLTYPY